MHDRFARCARRRRRPGGDARGDRGARRRRGRRVAFKAASDAEPFRCRGGINAALGNSGPDSPESHAFDTVKGSDYLGDQDAIEIFADEAPADIYELEAWGCIFSRDEDGRIAQRPFGAAASPRAIYSADITGHVLLHVCYE